MNSSHVGGRAGVSEARWFYQVCPHDAHDYDGINESILLDTPVNGQMREVLVRPERNGYIYYVLDRITGEVLSADAYVYITSTKGVDLKTGRMLYAEEKKPQMGKVIQEICPAAPGTKDWQSLAFSPKTDDDSDSERGTNFLLDCHPVSGRPQVKTPLLFVLGFVFIFVLGEWCREAAFSQWMATLVLSPCQR